MSFSRRMTWFVKGVAIFIKRWIFLMRKATSYGVKSHLLNSFLMTNGKCRSM